MGKKKKITKNSTLVDEVVKTFVDKHSIKTDPNGSYTGKAADPYAVPVQDQDDL